MDGVSVAVGGGWVAVDIGEGVCVAGATVAEEHADINPPTRQTMRKQ
jgi:hypothetical protein